MTPASVTAITDRAHDALVELRTAFFRVNNELETSRNRWARMARHNAQLRKLLGEHESHSAPQTNYLGSSTDVDFSRGEELELKIARSAIAARDTTIMDLQHEMANFMDALYDTEEDFLSTRDLLRSELKRNWIARNETRLAVKAAADTLRKYIHSLMSTGTAKTDSRDSALNQLDKLWRNL